MLLNKIKPAPGSKHAKKRLGRGVGSELGKTAGRGHKGQHARAGGFHKIGFEGGQMPLQRRLPKFGFASRIAPTRAQIRLSELNQISAEVIDVAALKSANLVAQTAESVKVFLSGELKKPVKLRGVKVTAGAKKAIETAGGEVLP
ncbi:MAG: 50S ribosomal protein L15 [Gammaproteobacteria bacterium RIFCSPLOWO2_02_FULL_42_14]|nr:MAG: 50S ribosomal protein L15 [Gammaproteobacteria bacterium RIFCSPHIGHO2_02_FULL_42_43]OGT28756.1 MAG: 50S ribosomal protein L15 [Gammaproteobacteria bacterium RIFCSPHIGHO2_01_FULL_42_8]OGT52189.1 MAG: 50S ribosomal protein L15 [Gammaproteobacteria bacterium RIFCSPHIGHO2_12_FULL_41_25]OGT62630.1 MAG: 50S ribosomal protein L15 [Gammaproteobacteria bacterium RIFCSPLOWO2_02_FULL_42_14]OGT86614.1 MAG: 50S ribosomal protein L15 [Gammaproteobacteria bacterium RIFCSPLOWO2_12_FULL_42_18]